MSQINPFIPAVAGTPVAQHQQSAEKTQQIRRARILTKSAIVPDDTFEHQVESADRVSAVHDGASNPNQRQHSKRRAAPSAGGE